MTIRDHIPEPCMGIEQFSLANKRVYVAGHRGMVGSAIMRQLAGYQCELITAPHADLDLERQEQTEQFIANAAPHVIIIAAAKVGGIHANNTYPADFISENIAIARNIIHAGYKAGVQKLLFLGSSCIYPRLAKQPIREEELLEGLPEPTNEWYAIAKIAGIKLCQAYRRQYGADFISLMPPNLYGPGDNYHSENSHVIPALIRRLHQSKLDGVLETAVWGSGSPKREFMFVDDLADACLFVLQRYSEESHLNVGTGEEVTIAELAQLIADVVGYQGRLVFDPTRPDGTPRKLLDIRRLHALGWKSSTTLREGLSRTYNSFLAERKHTR